MNWSWLRGRRRRVTPAGGLPHDGAGQPARGKAAWPILCGWLTVVIAGAAAGCAGSPGSTGPGRAGRPLYVDSSRCQGGQGKCSMGPGFSHDRKSFVSSVGTLSGGPGWRVGASRRAGAGPACPCFLAQGPQRLRAQGWGLKMLSAERLERILGCPCGWRGGPVRCEAPTRHGAQPVLFRHRRDASRRPVSVVAALLHAIYASSY